MIDFFGTLAALHDPGGWGWTLLDWGLLVWVLLFSLHGFLRGGVAQIFVVLGVLGALWAALWVWRWLGAHWAGEQPALLFLALRWIVSALAGAAVAAVVQWVGERLSKPLQSGPVAWVDRSGGLALGALVGLATAAVVIMALLVLPRPRSFAEQAKRARWTTPLMASAAQACSLSVRVLPAGPWLTRHFQLARGRSKATHTATSEPRS